MIRQALGRLAQALFRPFGVRLQRITPRWFLEGDGGGVQSGLEGQWLDAFHFGTVIDIGAHDGSFSEWALRRFPGADVLAFEPQRAAYQRLLGRFSGQPRFKAFNVAIGAATGSAALFYSQHSPASSLLKMTAVHVDNFPFAKGTGEEQVAVAPLDDYVRAGVARGPIMVKIDVQGYEKEVLEGAQGALKLVDMLVIELSLEALYEGQPLFDEIYSALIANGFRYRGNVGQLRSPLDGRILQVDAAFARAP